MRSHSLFLGKRITQYRNTVLEENGYGSERRRITRIVNSCAPHIYVYYRSENPIRKYQQQYCMHKYNMYHVGTYCIAKRAKIETTRPPAIWSGILFVFSETS